MRRIRLESKVISTDVEVRGEQQAVVDIKPILVWMERNERPKWNDIVENSAITKCYWAQWDSLKLEDGVLKRKWESPDGKRDKLQIVVPRSEVSEVLVEVHGGTSGSSLSEQDD